MPDNTNYLSPRWTAPQTAKARKLWLAGVKVSAIAFEVRRERNAVISKAARSGWGPHPNRYGQPCS